MCRQQLKRKRQFALILPSPSGGQSHAVSTLFCDFSKQAVLLVSPLRLRARWPSAPSRLAFSGHASLVQAPGCRMLFIRLVNRAVHVLSDLITMELRRSIAADTIFGRATLMLRAHHF